MLKAIIIDDEFDARQTLVNFIGKYCKNVEVTGEAEGVESGLNLLKSHQPDIVFLDIQMEDGNGFDLLKKVDKIDFDVIFTTAYDEYAVKAFKFNATDYLLKPIDPVELVNAINKAEKERSKTPIEKKLNILMETYENQQFKTITLSTVDEMHFINISDIIRCEADGNYTQFHLLNGKKITVPTTLKEYDEMLPSSIFYRIHQSHLINVHYIKKYVKKEGGYVIMLDNSELEVARRRKDSFLEKLSSI